MADSVRTGSTMLRLGMPSQRAGGSQYSVSEKSSTSSGPSTKFGQRDAEHRHRHRAVIELRVLLDGRDGAGGHADDERQQIGEDADGRRHRHGSSQDLVDRSALVLQRRAEVAAQRVAHHPSVLDVPRLIEPVLRPDVLFDGGRKRALAAVEVAGREPDQPPRQRHDHEHHRDGDQQPADDESKHVRR